MKKFEFKEVKIYLAEVTFDTNEVKNNSVAVAEDFKLLKPEFRGCSYDVFYSGCVITIKFYREKAADFIEVK